MKKTDRMAQMTEWQFRGHRGTHTTIERRIYADGNGIEYVKVNGGWFELSGYQNSEWHQVETWHKPAGR